MKIRNILLAILAVGIVLVAAAWFILTSLFREDPIMVDISTDKSEYRVGETVHIHITSYDHQVREIYSPLVCASGNFPTGVEKVTAEGESEYLATFCPNSEPLTTDYRTKDGYIIYPLAPGESYDLEIVNFAALNLQGAERLRIVYYLNAGRSKIYSAEFEMKP